MVNTHDNSNMYYSDDGYDTSSEYPYEADLSDDEYDSDSEYYDDGYLNSSDTFLVSTERLQSETRRADRVKVPQMVHLLSEVMAKETGCTTMQQWMEKQQLEDEKRQAKKKEEEIAKKKEEEIAKKAAEKAEKAKWDKILASLPTESRLGKQKRLAKERAERQLKSKLTWLARKKKRKSGGRKSLPFGHRRNGGGKRRTKMAQHGTQEADQLTAVIKKRRATRRKLVQKQKKEAEEKRAKEFKMFGVEKVNKIVTINYIKEVEDEEVDETVIEEERKQTEMIRKIQIRKATEEADAEERKKAKIDAKIRAEFAKREAALVDERENGRWSIVEPKKPVHKPVRKSSSTRKTKKKILAINLLTPRMAEAEKLKEGRSRLMDKTGMQSRLTKTRMCNSVGSGKPCRHGSRCRYAHSVDELKVGQCFFKDACRHVHKTATGYSNHRHKCCSFIHPGESMKNYCSRLGLKYTAKKSKSVTKPLNLPMPRLGGAPIIAITPSVTNNVWKKRSRMVEPKVEPKVDEKWIEVKRTSKTRKSSKKSSKKSVSRPSSKNKVTLCNSVGSGKPCRHGKKCRFQHVHEVHSRDQVVLRVPHSLAVKAMQHAVASGIKNFRVVVV